MSFLVSCYEFILISSLIQLSSHPKWLQRIKSVRQWFSIYFFIIISVIILRGIFIDSSNGKINNPEIRIVITILMYCTAIPSYMFILPFSQVFGIIGIVCKSAKHLKKARRLIKSLKFSLWIFWGMLLFELIIYILKQPWIQIILAIIYIAYLSFLILWIIYFMIQFLTTLANTSKTLENAAYLGGS